MKSHTVPKKLLEQFAYDDPVTKQKRLWRYAKGMKPYKKASPSIATVVEGQFIDPRDEAKEAELEARLNREFEQPVNLFIEHAGYRTFAPTAMHIRQLSAYIFLLFHRSKARRTATTQQVEIISDSIEALLKNEEQLRKIAGKWTMDIIGDGHRLRRPVNVEEVRARVVRMRDDYQAADQLQHTYAGTMERAMARLDRGLETGNWDVLHTEPSDPFVIGDAPVVTWERLDNNFIVHGQGFNKPNVEAFLPVSPIACLHIRPNVPKTRPLVSPTTQEVNIAQAAFSAEACYTNLGSDSLDAMLQPHFGRAKLGVTAFSVRHRNYDNTMFDILMNKGNWVETPRG